MMVIFGSGTIIIIILLVFDCVVAVTLFEITRPASVPKRTIQIIISFIIFSPLYYFSIKTQQYIRRRRLLRSIDLIDLDLAFHYTMSAAPHPNVGFPSVWTLLWVAVYYNGQLTAIKHNQHDHRMRAGDQAYYNSMKRHSAFRKESYPPCYSPIFFAVVANWVHPIDYN